jgi:His-Xaa-Ser system protein HxsD
VSSPDGFRSDVESDSSATIYLDARIYSKDAVLRACYWFTDIAYIRVPESPGHELAIRIELKQMTPTLANPKLTPISQFIGEFCNSLLDFELRRQIESETLTVRQIILAKAFSESGVLEDEPRGVVADPVESANPSSLVQLMNPSAPSQK